MSTSGLRQFSNTRWQSSIRNSNRDSSLRFETPERSFGSRTLWTETGDAR